MQDITEREIEIVIPLVVDELPYNERGESQLILAEKAQAFARESQITLRLEEKNHAPINDARETVELAFKLFAHPFGGLEIEQLVVHFDFGVNLALEVKRIDPERVQEGMVEVTEERSLNLKPKDLPFETGMKRAVKRTNSPDVIVGSVFGKTGAIFQLSAPDGKKVRPHQVLKVWVERPTSVTRVYGKVNVTASLRAPGLVGRIPLLGRKGLEWERAQWLGT